jgi:hypothetical protein
MSFWPFYEGEFALYLKGLYWFSFCNTKLSFESRLERDIVGARRAGTLLDPSKEYEDLRKVHSPVLQRWRKAVDRHIYPGVHRPVQFFPKEVVTGLENCDPDLSRHVIVASYASTQASW